MVESSDTHESRLWYLLPIFLHVVGGLVGYSILRKSDSALARKVLWTGVIFSAAMAAVIIVIYASFQADMAFARERISKGSQITNTANGTLEFVDIGNGYPVLILHGAGGGFDQGILLSQLFLGDGIDKFRVIAPSRFGFLHTPLPDGGNQESSFAAQADAFADLLDGLNIRKVAVIGFSAGGPSSIDFALRHPDKTSHLILVSAVIHKEPPLQSSDDAVLNGFFKSDFAFWFVGKYMEPQFLSFLGVTPEAQATLRSEDKVWISNTFIPSMNPISPRQPGMLNDRINFISIDYPLERISVPTLIINSQDDTLVNPSHSIYAEENIPDAKHVEFESGGHVLLGHHMEARKAITEFLAR